MNNKMVNTEPKRYAMNHSRETNNSKSIIILLVAMVIAIFADWSLSGRPLLLNAGLDVAGLLLGFAAAAFLHRVPLKDLVAIIVFVLGIPLLLALLAWVPQVQSGGYPVFLYLLSLIICVEKPSR